MRNSAIRVVNAL